MSYSIGKKIYDLRTQRKMSQDDIASKLGISRQRLARIENGQSDISYTLLQKTAEILAIPINTLTSADQEVDLRVFFRDADNSDTVKNSVEKIVEILKTFHAHEKLYFRMKGENDEI